MSDVKTHQLLGALVGLGGYIAYKKSMNEPVDIGHAVGSTIAGSLVATFPDVLEPATNSNHRGFLHSKGLLLLLA